jgi:chromosome segregation ATPase
MVENLDKAIEYSKKYFVDCITLKGEIYRRGAITCDIGYTTLKNDCIQSYIDLRTIGEAYHSSKNQIEGFDSGLRTITDELTKKTNECYELELKKDKKVLEYKHSVSEVAGIKHSLIQM